jgi:colanic acid/amylovoran biosynthesis protein
MSVFIREVAALIRAALRQGLTQRIALVAHCRGPTATEDDRIPTAQLARELRGEAVCSVEDDLSARELAAFYSHGELTIGTRLHSVILSLVAGTPAFAVSYFGPKTQGVMQMLGMDQYWVNLADFTADATLPRVASLKTNAARSSLERRVEFLRGWLVRDTAALLHMEAAQHGHA